MKTRSIAILLVWLFCTLSRVYAFPQFELTLHGIVNSEDQTPYVVIDFPGHDRTSLIRSLREYVQKYWNDPQESLKIESDFVSIDYYHIVSVGSKEGIVEGTMRIEVKDDKIRIAFNLVALYRHSFGGAYFCFHATKDDCPTTYETMGGGHKYYARKGIFDKNGQVKYPEQKAAIEGLINGQLNKIADFIGTQSSDW